MADYIATHPYSVAGGDQPGRGGEGRPHAVLHDAAVGPAQHAAVLARDQRPRQPGLRVERELVHRRLVDAVLGGWDAPEQGKSLTPSNLRSSSSCACCLLTTRVQLIGHARNNM